MTISRINPLIVTLVAVILVIAAVAAGWAVFQGDPTLLSSASIEAATITPNADGDADVTTIRYEISHNATVSIYFEDETGQRYYFREEQPRGVGRYQVLFSGVVAGYALPDEKIEGEILARLLPNGRYTWTITAQNENGPQEAISGQLTIAQADDTLPELRNFTIDRPVFSPNQDGIDDRALIQFFLPKEVASLRVFLLTPEGVELPIAEQERNVPANMPGRHYFDYEGGVDNKATPPPDGTYPIIAIAEDAEGQKIRVEEALTIEFGGVPRAEIISPAIGDTVTYESTTVVLCDTLVFTLTVENYGDTPIRTTGPPPGTLYDSDWNYNTLGWHTESGAWRVAIGYENEISNYPYRWAIGSLDDLERIGDAYYLMPGQRATITGSIRIVGPLGERNPQPVWAGLIHEDVEISQFNNRVDTHNILIDLPDPENIEACEPRAVPERE